MKKLGAEPPFSPISLGLSAGDSPRTPITTDIPDSLINKLIIFYVIAVKMADNNAVAHAELLPRELTDDEKASLASDKVTVSDFKQQLLEKDAMKNWDMFYKRNTTAFYKDRHWTSREFPELNLVVNLFFPYILSYLLLTEWISLKSLINNYRMLMLQ